MGIIQDNVGAFVRVWHSAAEHGVTPSNAAGHMNWNELQTKDPEKAARFYERVFGVHAERMMSGPAPVLAATAAFGRTSSQPSWSTRTGTARTC